MANSKKKPSNKRTLATVLAGRSLQLSERWQLCWLEEGAPFPNQARIVD
jgi:hypothetical protein